MKPLDAALWLAANDVPVFPCYDNKNPRTPHGWKNATTDPDIIERWWRNWRWPYLIGVPTGLISGVIVLDIDPKHDGDAWERDNRNRLPRTRIHRTRSGGRHYLFAALTGMPMQNSAGRIAPGVDVRGDGGYLIWWPPYGCEVVRDVPLDRLAPWPAWLTPPPAPQRPPAGHRIPDRHQLDVLQRFVAESAEGQRNARLFWAACRAGEMLMPGMLDEGQALAWLIEAAARTGITAHEAERTARSGLATGQRSTDETRS